MDIEIREWVVAVTRRGEDWDYAPAVEGAEEFRPDRLTVIFRVIDGSVRPGRIEVYGRRRLRIGEAGKTPRSVTLRGADLSAAPEWLVTAVSAARSWIAKG